MSTRRRSSALVVVALATVAVASAVPGLDRLTGGTGARPAAAAAATIRTTRVIDQNLGTVGHSQATPAYFTSPAVTDLDGDDQPEVVVAGPDGRINATRAVDGSRLWQTFLGTTVIHASPVVVDIDRNGSKDVVIATMDGRVVVLDGRTGRVRVTHRQGAPLYCPAGVDCRPDGFFSTPVVLDVNGDGRLDIVAASHDHTVYAWTWNGGLLWRRFFYDTLWSSPAVGDIDGDGKPEIVFGGDIYPGNPLGVPQGGLMWVIRARDGSTYPGYPKSIPGQTVWSSPALADLNRDGNLDIVVGTGTHGDLGDDESDRRVYAFTARTRRVVIGWPVAVGGRVVSQPAVGDIDGDGVAEVVVASEYGWVTAFEPDGRRRWRACNAFRPDLCGDPRFRTTHGGAVIADVDDDGAQEVVSTLDKRTRILDGRTGAVEATQDLSAGGAPLGRTNPSPSVAAVAEVEGRTLIVQSTIYQPGGANGRPRAGDSVRTYLMTTDRALCARDWPAFKRGPERTSLVTAPAWAPFACPRPFIRQQYRDFLGREPDAGGLAYWTARMTERGMSGRAIVLSSFMGSAEFGHVASPVLRVHIGLVGPPPWDAALIRGQMTQIGEGRTLAEVAQDLAARPAHSGLSVEAFVDRIHRNLFGRAPTTSERETMLAELSGGTTRGRALADLAEEPVSIYTQFHAVRVGMAYLGLLARSPDAGGFDFWLDQARRGISPEALIGQFLASAEYRARVL